MNTVADPARIRSRARRAVRILSQPWLALAAITLLAAGFRLADIGSLPRGLYLDEAMEGLDALKVIAGQRPIYLPDNNGREPLFAYLVAISISIFGRSPGAIRIVAALAGLLTVPGIYLVASSLFTRRIGLLAAFAGAVTLWPIMLSRFGVRAPLLPLVLSLSLWQGIRGWQTGRWQSWLASGLLWGVAVYTYVPVHAMWIAPAIFGAYLFAMRRGSKLWPGALLFALGTVVVALPLAVYALRHSDIIIGRAAQVSAIDWSAGLGGVAARLAWQVYVVLQMFVWRGDANPRHNIHLRPVFDAVMALPFIIGLALSLRRRHLVAIALCSLWVAAGLLPTILADEPPHFLRASAILPVLFIWPALGLEWLCRQGRRLVRPPVGAMRSLSSLALLVPAALLSLSTFVTTRDYLLDRYLAGPAALAYFSAGPTDVAVAVNRFLGIGWQGAELMVRPPGAAAPSKSVWVDERLWGSSAQSFLVPVGPGPGSPLHILTPGSDPFSSGAAAHIMLIVPPGEEGPWIKKAPSGYTTSVVDGPWIPATRLGPAHLTYRALFMERRG